MKRRPIPVRSCLLLFSYLSLGHPSGYFPSSNPNKTPHEFISPHTCYMPPAIAVCLFSLPNNVWRGKPVLKLLFILYSLLLSPKISSSIPHSRIFSAYILHLVQNSKFQNHTKQKLQYNSISIFYVFWTT